MKRTKQELKNFLTSENDTVLESMGQLSVTFHNETGKEVVSIYLKENNLAVVAMSSCLPTTSWAGYADAYARSIDFVRTAGLTDIRKDNA